MQKTSILYEIVDQHLMYKGGLIIEIEWEDHTRKFFIKVEEDEDGKERIVYRNERLNKFIDKVAALRIPPLAEGSCGLDGTNYCLMIGRDSTVSAYKWWEELPSEWKSLEAIIRDMEEIASGKIALKDMTIEDMASKDVVPDETSAKILREFRNP